VAGGAAAGDLFPMALPEWVKRSVPPRWQVPMRYHYRRLIGVIEREVGEALSLVRPGSAVADVGANDGMYSYAFTRRAGTVHAFEPLPGCAGIVRAYARANARIHVHQVALSDEAGTRSLTIPLREGREIATEASLVPQLAPQRGAAGAAGAAGARVEEIEVRTLDSFALRDLSLIKIDVEGHELEVLRGGRETLRSERPVMMIEIEQRHHGERDIRDVFAEVESYGYSGWTLARGGGLQPIAGFDAPRDQRAGPDGAPGPGYVNNFFWLPVEGRRR
jgi:FkbM family methyltransferase